MHAFLEKCEWKCHAVFESALILWNNPGLLGITMSVSCDQGQYL